jgi:hypothetical protein
VKAGVCVTDERQQLAVDGVVPGGFSLAAFHAPQIG